ncbi:glycoside hydrolase [Aspergillus falconensis]
MIAIRRSACLLALSYFQISLAFSQKDGLGKLPAMGWNPWNAYKCNISEAIVMSAAIKIVELGLKSAGYEYVNIDDCWSVKSGRDNVTNELIPDPINFPRGIKGVADDVHALGLKLGIYSSAGTETCAEYPASLGYEDIDAASFASWGVDYLKYDNCGVPSNWTDEYNACTDRWTDTVNGTCIGLTNPAPPGYDWGTSLTAVRYRRMRDALRKQNWPILYALCPWGFAEVNTWAEGVGSSFRMSKDIRADWSRIKEILNRNSFLMNYNEPGSRPDADMLEIGNNGLTFAEERSHFALWALMKSPLIMGASLTSLTADQLTILKNPYLIGFNQDPVYGAPATPYKWGTNPDWTFNSSFPAEYWSGESRQGTFVALLNIGSTAVTKTAVFDEIPYLNDRRRRYRVVDAWTGEDWGCHANHFTTTVEGHDTAVIILKPC